ncbi:MAG: asparagine synthase-related protein [Thermoproteota archaeon]
MKHRGDNIDIFTDNDLSLATVGHGEQPKPYYDGRIIMAMDQDVYAVENKVVEDPSSVYSSLRSNVSNKLSLIKNLRGSFSLFLAEINGRVKRAILARDIYGTRSLYYLKFDNVLFFASEMKCFLAIEDLKPALNTKVLNFYLTCGFSPTRETIIKNVYKLLPAEIMEYNDGVLNHTIYWSPKASKYGVNDLNYWAKATFITLLNTTKMLLSVREKKLGIALSGGLDSSLTAALIRQVDKEREIISFSLDYSVEDGTELKAATEVAEYLNLERRVVQLDPERVVRDLETLQWIYDEPMIKFTFIPTYYIFKDAKKYVRTIFTGDGGDELFIGYRRDYWEDPMPIKIFAKLPNGIRKSFLKLGKPLIEALANVTGFKILSLASEFFMRESASHPKWQYRIASRVFQGYFAEEELPKLLKCYSNSCNVVNEIAKLLDSSNSNNSSEKTSHVMIMRKLPDDLLRLDKAVVATGVKARSPFLDLLMTNFALSIPIQLKYCGRTTKFLIRYMVKRYGLLPAKITDARGKRGLTAPLHYWFSRTCLRDYVDNLLGSDVNFLDANYVKKIWPPKTYTKVLKVWNLAALLLWFKTFPEVRFS